MMTLIGHVSSHPSRFLAAACVLLSLAACAPHKDDLSLACEGQRRLLRGNVSDPIKGVRESVEDRSERYALTEHKFDGVHECQVWGEEEIRCDYSKPDGTYSRSFRLERDSLRVHDQVFTRGRTLTENVSFEGECKAL